MEKEDSINLKEIENEAFTQALNQYFLTTDLAEIVSSAVNTDQLHLLANPYIVWFWNNVISFYI